MKAIIFIVLSIFVFSCTKKNSEKTENSAIAPSDFVNHKTPANNAEDYHTVPAVISTESIQGNMDKGMAFLNENDFAKKADDPVVSWRYFDSQYQSIPNKIPFYTQQYGYNILIKKSLLDENSAEAMEKIKFYTEELVKTGYKGYGTLYFALKKLNENSGNREFVITQLDKIAVYAAKDKQSQDMLNEDVSKAPEKMQKHLGRVKFNAQFIAKLESLR